MGRSKLALALGILMIAASCTAFLTPSVVHQQRRHTMKMSAHKEAWSRDEVFKGEGDFIFPNVSEPAFTRTVYLDLESQGGKAVAGRIEIGLYGDVVPRTVENFVRLCQGSAGVGYAGSNVYRILKDFNIQAGDIGASKRGSSGKSSFGEPFERENFRIKHNLEGLVSMAIDRDKKVDSRFFINLSQDGGWADDRYVCFGRVTKGMDVLKQLEKVEVSSNGTPNRKVLIKAAGLVDPNSQPAPAAQEDSVAAGDAA